MSYRQALRLVIFPQMWGYLIPSLSGIAVIRVAEKRTAGENRPCPCPRLWFTPPPDQVNEMET